MPNERWIFSLVVLDVLVHADHDGPQLGQLQRHLPPDAVTRPRDQDHLPCNVTSRDCHVSRGDNTCYIPQWSRLEASVDQPNVFTDGFHEKHVYVQRKYRVSALIFTNMPVAGPFSPV